MVKFAALAAFMGSVASLVTGLGINCQGSYNCAKNGAIRSYISQLGSIDQRRTYKNGEHIMCKVYDDSQSGAECLFLQGTNGGLQGSSIGGLVQALADHGCNDCGR